MLSHLRFHRRGNSNPSSPVADLPPSLSQASSLSPEDISPRDGRPASSGSFAGPPILPPIRRVTSIEDQTPSQPRRDGGMEAQIDQRSQQMPQAQAPRNAGPGFMGGDALRQYRRDAQPYAVGRSEMGDEPAAGHLERPFSQYRPMSDSTRVDQQLQGPPPQSLVHPRPATSFSTPTELQNSTASSMTGRRPAGTRLATEPPRIPASSGVEPQRAKKSLPFLKNPMSTLLMRRKNTQDVPNLTPLPLGGRSAAPAYDPRIRGTVVHDFSAPRRRDISAATEAPSSRSTSYTDLYAYQERKLGQVPETFVNDTFAATQQPRRPSDASDPVLSGTTSRTSQLITQSPSLSSQRTGGSVMEQMLPRNSAAPPVPPKDNVTVASGHSYPSSQMSSGDVAMRSGTTSSRQTSRSRNVSLSEASTKDSHATPPKHMKSTSSRFSFDMIGAAKQEKLLEDRHRVRELKRQSVESSQPPEPQDSRFDDMEDDSFDYDAMMDDDGLEERIPGVNADVEDEDEEEYPMEGDMDPSDDQQNFSGFVFQRSNPNSSLASPNSAGIMATPRDPEGEVIGFAMSKDSPGLQNFAGSSRMDRASLKQPSVELQTSGLGIQGVNASTDESQTHFTTEVDDTEPTAKGPRTTDQDELYYDDGMLGIEGEFAEDLALGVSPDDEPFDESIFDLNDTDHFGRPVPGAFAQAQASLQGARAPSQEGKDPAKRESDMLSRFSAQSGTSRSTAHTSLSLDTKLSRPGDAAQAGPPPWSGNQASMSESRSPNGKGSSISGYQAALAAAATEAAASGKFTRGTSPTLGADSSPVDGFSNLSPDPLDESLDNYEDEYDDDVDGFDMNDDAIIAEANASALANDSDGWYGQEFGFYAAAGQGQHHISHKPSSSKSVDYEFASGGFFGPKGMDGLQRSTSGHMLSREANLTPITERSEYSNRNSLMNLMPPFGPGTPSLQSPGLAQLASMADLGDDQMTLSALLRLRSRAFGGSQASLVSSKEGSPRSDRGEGVGSPWRTNQGGMPGVSSGDGRKNSVYSIVSRDSEPGSAPGSPTLTAGMLDLSYPSPVVAPPEHDDYSAASAMNDGRMMPPPIISPQPQHLSNNVLPTTGMMMMDTPLSAVSELSEMHWAMGQERAMANMPPRRAGMGHRPRGSADSISYSREEDSGETRWVMERRRTGESGEVEILGREIVEGGRI